MNVHPMGGKMVDCGVPQPTTTKQMRSGAFVKVSSSRAHRLAPYTIFRRPVFSMFFSISLLARVVTWL